MKCRHSKGLARPGVVNKEPSMGPSGGRLTASTFFSFVICGVTDALGPFGKLLAHLPQLLLVELLNPTNLFCACEVRMSSSSFACKAFPSRFCEF